MNDFFKYLVELNIALSIFYVVYQIVFHKDCNFMIRRYYLFSTLLLAFTIPLVPGFMPGTIAAAIPVFSIEGVTIFGDPAFAEQASSVDPLIIASIIYFTIAVSGLIRLSVQLVRIIIAINQSEERMINGHKVLSSRLMHASSFFHYIFIDLRNNKDESISHILNHEVIHKNENHSIDRILTELAVLICWFNPFVWLYRRSVIENHEYLADSGVITGGANIYKYQMSILNQYIESASITNQFSSHIKKRIKMLNTSHKFGGKWKIAMLLPVAMLAFFLISCTEQKEDLADITAENSILPSPEVFFVVEDMPTFSGGEASEFRKYIAQNVRYPKEAAENGVSGKIIIKFIVSADGKVVVPDKKLLAQVEGEPLDEVVVVTYRPLNEEAAQPDEKYIDLLMKEAIRVVSESPDWEPGKQRGKAVNVMFTFPINFVLQ